MVTATFGLGRALTMRCCAQTKAVGPSSVGGCLSLFSGRTLHGSHWACCVPKAQLRRGLPRDQPVVRPRFRAGSTARPSCCVLAACAACAVRVAGAADANCQLPRTELAALLDSQTAQCSAVQAERAVQALRRLGGEQAWRCACSQSDRGRVLSSCFEGQRAPGEGRGGGSLAGVARVAPRAATLVCVGAEQRAERASPVEQQEH